MPKRNLLFITEGEVDEPKFIDRVFKKCYPNIEYNYYSYTTDIHTLARLIFKNNDEIDEYLDIRMTLKETETNEYKKDILSKSYSDIILVFDFDPQSSITDFKKIYKMLEYFDDSTNNGKLYVNYPMMQSYRHICTYPAEDYGFKDRQVEIKDCSNYKQIIQNESCLNNINKYDYPKIMKIIEYHLKKANYIFSGNYSLPDEEKIYEIDLKKIYILQCKKAEKEQKIYVLNTFIFHLIEYNPRNIINRIKSF